MLDELFGTAGQQLLGTGIVGALCVVLLWVVFRREQELKDTRTAYEIRLAEKDKLLLELQESRLQEVRLMGEQTASNRVVVESNNVAIQKLLSLVEVLLTKIAQLEALVNEHKASTPPRRRT